MNTPARKWALSIFLPLMAVVMFASNAYAQSQNVSGIIVDQSGAAIQNANVKITDEAKNALVREVTTDENGRFQALGIQPGAYALSIEATGFKRLLLSNVTLDVNTKLDVGELKLEVGEVADSVQITGETPLVQTNTMEKAYSIEFKQVQELPLNGRNWVALMSTIPGVTAGQHRAAQ